MEQQESLLTPSQRSALGVVRGSSSNLCILGGPGTGKSFLLKVIQDDLALKRIMFSTLAPRGSAAFLVGGNTMHSKLLPFPRGAGILRDAPELREALRLALRGRLGGGANSRAKAREEFWKGLQVIFIDEVFLCDGGVFALTDLTARACRSDDRPFGGMRVVCMGDPFQISPRGATFHPFRPVRVREEDEDADDAESGVGGCFLDERELRPWESLRMVHLELTENKRAEADSRFRALLEAIRAGTPVREMTLDVRDLLLSLCIEGPPPGDAVILYWSREDTSTHNSRCNASVEGQPLAVLTVTSSLSNGEDFPKRLATEELRELAKLRDEFVKRLPGEGGEVVLKQGSSVMLLTNLDVANGAHRGAVGTVADVVRDNDSQVVSVRMSLATGGEPIEIKPRKEVISHAGLSCDVVYWPLGFGWASTYDSIQGFTLDKVACAVTPKMPPGMLYTGMSRVRTSKDVVLFANVNQYNSISSAGRIVCDYPEVFRQDPHVVRFIKALRGARGHEVTDPDVFIALGEAAPPLAGPTRIPICVICGGAPTVAMQPCGHLATCRECWSSAAKDGARSCPECGAGVAGTAEVTPCYDRKFGGGAGAEEPVESAVGRASG